MYDSSKPDFTGEIKISFENTKSDTFLIAKWDKGAFTDHGDPNALRYEAAIDQFMINTSIIELYFNKLCR